MLLPRLVWCSCGRHWLSVFSRPYPETCPRCRKIASHHVYSAVEHPLAEVIRHIEAWLLTDDGVRQRNGWISDRDNLIKVYIRMTSHVIKTRQGVVDLQTTFDLAALEIAEEHCGKGWFRTIVKYLNANCFSRTGIYVESVVSPRFKEYFTSRPKDWIVVPGVANCFYQPFPGVR